MFGSETICCTAKIEAARRSGLIVLIFLLAPSTPYAQVHQAQQVRASDDSNNDQLGHAVSVSGDWLAAAARFEDSRGVDAGAIYMYRFENNTWSEHSKLTASDAEADDHLGESLAISGDYVIAAANLEDTKGLNAGAAYIFEWDGQAWFEAAKLTASDGKPNDEFGRRVAIDGNVAVVGIRGVDSARKLQVYVFERISGIWEETAILTHYPNGNWDQFGTDVDVEGDVIVVGASRDNSSKTGGGAVTIFRKTNGTWQEEAFLTASDAAANDWFGESVSISGDRIAVGAIRTDLKAKDSGSVYLFVKGDTGWEEEVVLAASNGAESRVFGSDVELSEDVLLVGTNGNFGLAPIHIRGAVPTNAYVYTLENGVWIEKAVLETTPLGVIDMFGISVSQNDNVIVVGAELNRGLPEGEPASGTVFVYDRDAIVVSVEPNADESSLPSSALLSQNYPNPFNPQTTIGFTLERSQNVTLDIYDLIGNRIGVLKDGIVGAGDHNVTFDGSKLATGVYLYRLQTETTSITRSMTLLR